MAKLNWFLSLKNMAKSDATAKQLLESINSAESEELKEKAKLEAREYIESFADSEPEKPAEPEPIVEPEHIEVESKVEQAKQELEVDLDTPEDTGERPEPQPPVNSELIARIERRQKIAEENARKRRNQPITLKEQKEWSMQKAREIDERNKMMAEMRKKIKEQVAQAQAEAKAHNEKNMVGLYTILKRELQLNIRLEVICEKHKITRADLDKLKANNPSGWEELLKIRPTMELAIDMYIK